MELGTAIIAIITAILGAGGLGALLPKIMPKWYDYALKKYAQREKSSLGEISRLSARLDLVEANHAKCLDDNAALRERCGRLEEAVRRLEGVKTVALVVCDDTGAIVEINQGTTLLFGYDPPELVGKNISVLAPYRLRGQQQQSFTLSIEEGKNPSTVIRETFALHENGDEIPVLVSLSSWTTNASKRMVAAEFRRR